MLWTELRAQPVFRPSRKKPWSLRYPGWPEITSEIAYKREVARRVGEPTTFFGRVWGILARPVHWIGELLSVGEYAVMNTARALIRAHKGLPAEDPVKAFLLGVRASFVDDPQHEITFLRVLKELGWRPETKSERFLRGVVGLAGSILFDPVTPVTFGVGSLGKKILPEVLREAAKETGLKLVRGLERAQWIKSKYARQISKDLMGRLVPKLKEAGYAGRALENELDRQIGLAFARLILPGEGVGATELIRAKGRDILEATLRALGKPVTEENLAWVAREGFLKVLDRGGIKYFGRTILGSRYLTPRTSGLVGLFLGNAWKHQVPLTYKLIDTALQSKLWQNIVAKPVKKLADLLRKSFVHYGRWDGEARRILKIATTGQKYLSEEVNRLIASMKVGGKTVPEIRLPGGTKVPLPVREIAPLKPNEVKLLHRLLIDARHELPARTDLAEWIYEKLKPVGAGTTHPWLKELGFGNRVISREDAQKYADVLEYWWDVFDSLHRWEEALGIASKAEEGYFPLAYRALPKLPEEEIRRANYFKPRRLDFGWDELVRRGYKPAPFEQAVFSRIYHSLSLALRQDLLEQAIYHLGKHQGALRQIAPALLANEELVRDYPRLAAELAEIVRTKSPWRGLTEEEVGTWRSLLRLLKAKRLGESHINQLAESIRRWTPPENLDRQTVEEMLEAVDEAVKAKKQALASKADPEDWRDFESLVNELKRKLAGEDVLLKLRQYLESAEKAKIRGTPLGLRLPATLYDIHKGPLVVTHGAVGPEVIRITDFTKDFEKISEDLPRAVAEGIRHIMRGWGRYDEAPELIEQVIRTAWPRFREVADLEARRKLLEAHFLKPVRRENLATVATDLTKTADQWRELEKQLRDRIRNVLSELREVGQIKHSLEKGVKSLALRYEYQFLRDMLRRVPSPDWLDKELPALLKLAPKVKDLLDSAERLGVRQELRLLIRKVLGKADIWALTESQIERLQDLLRKGRPRDVRAAVQVYTKQKEAIEQAWKNLERSRIKIKDPLTGELTPIERYALPREFAEALFGTALFKTPREHHPLTRALIGSFDWASGTLASALTRYFPSFYSRNVVDTSSRLLANVGRGFWDRRTWAEALAAVAGEEIDIALPGGRILTTRDIAELLRDMGLWHIRWGRVETTPAVRRYLKELIETSNSKLIVSWRGWAQDALKRFKEKFPGYKWITNFDANMENIALAAGAISMLKAGDTISDVERKLSRYLFDYNNLTPFERDVMRRIVLFYGYIRQSIPFGFTTLREARLRWYWVTPFKRIRDMAFESREEEAMVPEWIRDYPFIYVRKVRGKNPLVVSLRNVFSVDTIFGEWPTLSPHALLRMLNPIVIATFDLASGVDIYWGRRLKDVRFLSQEISRWWQEVPGFKQIGKWVQLRKVKLGGKEVFAVNGHRWYLLRRLWFSRFWRTMDDLAKFLDEPRVAQLMNLLIGIKATEIDIDRQQELIMHDAEAFRREYTRALNRQDYVRARQILEEVRLK